MRPEELEPIRDIKLTMFSCLLGRPKFAVLPPRIGRFHRVLDQHFLDMLALRTFKGSQIGVGGTRFDVGQHHTALTFGATWPLDRK